MVKLFKYFPWVVSGYLLISHIIGLAGIPEDIVTWKGWLNITYSLSKSMTVNQDIIQGIFLFTGLLIIFIYSGVYKKLYQKAFRSKLVEDKGAFNNTYSPLKIEIQKDGNAYYRVEDEKGNIPQGYKKQILSIRVYSEEAIDDVKVYINEIETSSYDNDTLQNLLPIPLNFRNMKDGNPVSLSADETQKVDVVSYSSGREVCHVQLEQFGEGEKPEVFMGEVPIFCKIQIKVTGKGVSSIKQYFEIFYTDSLAYNYSDNSRQRIFMKHVFSEDKESIESSGEQQKQKVERKADIINQLNQFASKGNNLLLKIGNAGNNQFLSQFPPKEKEAICPMEQELAEWNLAVYSYLKVNVPTWAEYYHRFSTRNIVRNVSEDYNKAVSIQEKMRIATTAFIEENVDRIIEIIRHVDSSSD